MQLAPVLLEDVDAPVVADRVGDPGADDVGRRAHGHHREQGVLPARDVEAREQERRLRGDRDARALGDHEHEDARQAEGVDHVHRELDDGVGEGGDDRHVAKQG